MERKTQIIAEEGKQEMVITREFDLPLDLLFRAYAEPELVGQWMGTKVLQLDSRKNGSYQFETSDSKGNIIFRAAGVIHDFVPNQKITRTFEIEKAPFGVQLEFYGFESLTDDSSKLTMHVLYETSAQRDNVLKFGMSQGINMAHNRIQDIIGKLK